MCMDIYCSAHRMHACEDTSSLSITAHRAMYLKYDNEWVSV